MERVYKCGRLRFVLLAMMVSGTVLQYVLNHDFGIMRFQEDLHIKTHLDPECPGTANNTYWALHINYSDTIRFRTIELSAEDRIFLQDSYIYGLMASQLISGILSIKCSAKNVVGYTSLFSAVINMFAFASEQLSYWALFSLRFAIAFFSTCMFPGYYSLVSRWAPPSERSLFVFGILLGLNIGVIILEPLCYVVTALISREAWYCTLSFLLLLWSIIWFAVIRNAPCLHPLISYAENLYITESQEHHGYHQMIMQSTSIPFKEIITSPAVWGLIIALFCHHWNLTLFFIFTPFYLTRILGFEVVKTSPLGLLPFVANSIGGFLFAAAVNFLIKKRIMTITSTRKLFAIPSFVIPGVLMLSEVSIGCESAMPVALLALILFLNSAVVATLLPNPIDIAPTLSSLIFAIANSIAVLSELFVPAVYAPMLGESNHMSNWRQVLTIGGSIYLFGGVIFIWLGTGELQHWCELQQQSRFDTEVFRRKYDKGSMPKVLSDIMEETESKVNAVLSNTAPRGVKAL